MIFGLILIYDEWRGYDEGEARRQVERPHHRAECHFLKIDRGFIERRADCMVCSGLADA